MTKEVTRYQNLCQQQMAEVKQLETANRHLHLKVTESEVIADKVFKEVAANFAKELNSKYFGAGVTTRGSSFNPDEIPTDLLNKQLIQTKVIVKRALELQGNKLI